ncbi:MAG TPA: hypothetical protein VF721_03605 [Pyrinomonadaceae bacterium]|jgi:CBS domain containing-hemolysin-like protein
MKRTVTEIIVEVEETVAVRVKEKSVSAAGEPNDLKDGHSTCPVCGQPLNKIIEVEKEESDK